jgi:hypothetical protein
MLDIDVAIISSFPTISDLRTHTALTRSDIDAIAAINERESDEPLQGGDALQGAIRYPGEAVSLAFANDELPN